MTVEEIAHKWAVNNKDNFDAKLEDVEFIYLKGLKKGLILARQEIQRRMVDLEDDNILMELQKVMEGINAFSSPSDENK